LAGALTLLAATSCLAVLAFGQSEIEYKVKAAFLFNFAKFTQWPATKFTAGEPLVIGCLSDPEFIDVLEATVANKTVRSRPIVVKRVIGADDLSGIHMLFVGRTKDDKGAALLSRAHEMHVLTVGENEGFTNRGGMIGFVPGDGAVRFAINSREAEGAGLMLSSKLVELAVNERGGRE
jgi:uncharacterized protein DUF4154